MSTPPPSQPRRSAGESKKPSPGTSGIVTRNGARKSKIQTRAMASGSCAKPSASVLAAKKKAQQRKKQNMDTLVKDHYQIAMESKLKVKGPTGFVTEPRMAEHRCLWDDNYPECPERLTSIIERCKELKLIEQCKEFQPRAATKEELLSLHEPSVYEMMESTHQNNNVEYLEELSSKYDAVYIHPTTHEMALLAAGSTIDMVERVVKGEVQNGVSMVRPPGHHAMRSEPCGYCVYNNVALAAKHAVDNLGVKRILIVDWDVHHGQATQQMFYDDPRVVYFSVHRYEHGTFWPNLRQSDYHYVGTGAGKGSNFNVPLNETGMTDADYVAVWHQLLLPVAYEYQPELIIVSAGYDAAIGCPEGEMQVTPACYGHLLHMLMSVTSRVCVVLEGGYCLPSLSEAAAVTLRVALGYSPPRVTIGEPCEEISKSILNCIYTHKRHWRCFNYQPTYKVNPEVIEIGDNIERHMVKVKWLGDETRAEKFATRDCYPIQDNETKEAIKQRLNHLRLVTDLSIPPHAVCYVFDQAMLKHKNAWEPGHVEGPERILRIHERHRDFGLLSRVHELTARQATIEELASVHTEQHLQRLNDLATSKIRDLNSQKDAYDSVYFHPDSMESAAVAAGSVLQAIDCVVSGSAASGVCVIRPPGHHADEDIPSGFCLINNVSVATRYALDTHQLRRVLVLDWDVHHGNGTQRITYADDRILYISIHRYDNGSFFPHSTDANYNMVGEGKGKGFNVNIPWNKRGMGDVEYLAAFTQVVLPIAYEYNPDLVLVSAGFDACVGDPLGGCKVTPECYGRLTHMLRGLAGGRVILCLEGGYNVTSISYAMTMCTKALLGDPITHNYDPTATCHWSAVETINNVISTHKYYWKSLKFQVALPSTNVLRAPLPSRGLVAETDENTCDTDQSLSSTLEDYSFLNGYVPTGISILYLEPKCRNGLNCGTDDENDNERAGTSRSSDTIEYSDPPSPPDGPSNAERKMLVDFLADHMHALIQGDMFAVVPLPWCPQLKSLCAIPDGMKFEQGTKCVNCDETTENWVCLHCFVTACGREVNAHMQAHYNVTHHPLSLSLLDLSVWCSSCEMYVDNAVLYDAKNNAHRCKFGEDMPWCYRDRAQKK